MSLHKEAIDWLVSQIPASRNNHYSSSQEKIYLDNEAGNLYVLPDVIEGESEVLHEVEVLDIKKSNYLTISKEKQLWIFLRGLEPFDRTCIVLVPNDAFVPLFNKILERDLVEGISLARDIGRLRGEVTDLTAYLDSYDMKQLKTLRKSTQELQLLVDKLTKQKWYIEIIKKLSGPEIKVDKNCPKCPFFISWLKVAHKKEFGTPLRMKEAEEVKTS